MHQGYMSLGVSMKKAVASKSKETVKKSEERHMKKLRLLGFKVIASGCALGVTIMVLSSMFGAQAFAGKADDTLNVIWQRELTTYDFYFLNVVEGTSMSQLICDTLIDRDPETQEYRPLLATSWKWRTPTQLAVELRQGVKFHDGKDFTAADVAYTLNWASDPASKVLTQQMVNWIDKVEQTGPYSVLIHLKKPNRSVIDLLAVGLPMYPKEYHSRVGTKGFSEKPIGTGPYRAVSIQVGTSALLEKNDQYLSGGPKGKPTIGKIFVRHLKDANIAMGELMTGRADWIWQLSADQAEQLERIPKVTVEYAESNRISYLGFRPRKELLATPSPVMDVRVREAMSYAINRDAIVKYLAKGKSQRLNSYCDPKMLGCLDGVASYPYDPGGAKKLLAEAGYPNGFSIDIYAYRDRPVTEAVIGDLKKVGIEAKLNFMQYAALYQHLVAGDVALQHTTWGGYGLMDVAWTLQGIFVEPAFDPAGDPEIHALIARGHTAETQSERNDFYAQAFRRIAKGYYWIPLYTVTDVYAYSGDLDYKAHRDGINRFYLAKWK